MPGRKRAFKRVTATRGGRVKQNARVSITVPKGMTQKSFNQVIDKIGSVGKIWADLPWLRIPESDLSQVSQPAMRARTRRRR